MYIFCVYFIDLNERQCYNLRGCGCVLPRAERDNEHCKRRKCGRCDAFTCANYLAKCSWNQIFVGSTDWQGAYQFRNAGMNYLLADM